MAQRLKHLPGRRETQVRSLGREDPLERKWQSTPVLLPRESHGGRSLVGYSSWGCKEWDTTKQLHFHFHAFLTFTAAEIACGMIRVLLGEHSFGSEEPHLADGL